MKKLLIVGLLLLAGGCGAKSKRAVIKERHGQAIQSTGVFYRELGATGINSLDSMKPPSGETPNHIFVIVRSNFSQMPPQQQETLKTLLRDRWFAHLQKNRIGTTKGAITIQTPDKVVVGTYQET